MGSTESDLTVIDGMGVFLGGLAGILGGVTAALGLLSFFGRGGSAT